jgi:putative spermidine/putrescine transport system ATP-binding protein
VQFAGGSAVAVPGNLKFQPGTRVIVSIRPEQLRISSSPMEGSIDGTIKAVMPLGPHVVYDIALPDGPSLKVNEPRETASELRSVGLAVNIKPISPASCRVFPIN